MSRTIWKASLILSSYRAALSPNPNTITAQPGHFLKANGRSNTAVCSRALIGAQRACSQSRCNLRTYGLRLNAEDELWYKLQLGSRQTTRWLKPRQLLQTIVCTLRSVPLHWPHQPVQPEHQTL